MEMKLSSIDLYYTLLEFFGAFNFQNNNCFRYFIIVIVLIIALFNKPLFLSFFDFYFHALVLLYICDALEEILPDKIFVKEISSRVTHRPTFEELNNELSKYYFDYDDYLKEGKNKDSEIVIQIKKAEDFSANKESTNTTTTTTTTPLNYQTHPQAIYTSRLLNFQNPRMMKISKGNLKS
ncbi:hypothetical protein Glove_228g121 [Diversispora epigaea]|uniref:Uncharacterized protein n=1 Tax=Diversispora epigaea TaxID=1348612 RepID=A0A397II25_9GLOM|nr:hypothetical protein Glove_228g121 [Diversispora epigaea]